MKHICLQFILAVFYLLIFSFSSLALEPHLLKVVVTDIEGRPIEGAKLFLYNSSNVRRPADFISNLSDRTGQMQIVLPPSKYWGVARFKADGKYGPLLPGDKHSGEPIEIDMTGSQVKADFVIADILELGQKKRSGATDSLRLKGRVFDTKGVPVANAYVFANRSKDFSELPDFISAWTGTEGEYEVYLPPGDIYFVAASCQFPLTDKEAASKPLVIEQGKIDIAIDINFTVN
jgi:hypothetical protein